MCCQSQFLLLCPDGYRVEAIADGIHKASSKKGMKDDKATKKVGRREAAKKLNYQGVPTSAELKAASREPIWDYEFYVDDE